MVERYEHVTPAGQDHIDSSPILQNVIERFWEAEHPERVMGGLYIGAERYSSVSRIGGLAIKVSSPTSSADSNKSGKPTKPENLIRQFDFLSELREHLLVTDPSITVPEQFFVLRSRHNGYLAGMTHMEDWLAYRDWAPHYFEDTQADDKAERVFMRSVKRRIKHAIDPKLRRNLTDLGLHRAFLHGGNLLMPATAPPGTTTPLCIIDQPGRRKRTWKT